MTIPSLQSPPASGGEEENMDAIDKIIINILQKEFPIEDRPYEKVAGRLGISEEALIARIQKMKKEGLIRRIGAVFDGTKLGRASVLCAARVPAERIESFVGMVNAYPGVTHNYLRKNEYNIWFTIGAASKEILEQNLKDIKEMTGVTDILEMRAVRTFKINASFDL